MNFPNTTQNVSMIPGFLFLYCRECGKRFIGLHIEYMAMVVHELPVPCPRCGSCRTRPWSWLPAKLADIRYKEILDRADNVKS